MAEVALLCDIPIHVVSDGIIGAFLNTSLAPGTQIVIHDDNSVIFFADGCFRTGISTRWFVAVPAKVDLKYKLRSIIDPSRAVFPHRNQFDALSRSVFLLAGHLTGTAAPTKLFINTDSEASHGIFLQLHSSAGVRKIRNPNLYSEWIHFINFLSGRIDRMNL
jgi:hypothetical protein